MRIYVGKFEFDGPGLRPTDLEDKPGVFVLLHCSDGANYELLDVGQFDNLRKSWNSVDFAHFDTSYPGTVSLAVLYDGDGDREARSTIVVEILKEYGQESCVGVPRPDKEEKNPEPASESIRSL